MPAIFYLKLAGLALSVCQDQSPVSDAYAEALGVAKGILDADCDRLVPRLAATAVAPEEPESLALSPDGLFLRRQRLMLELHAVDRRSFP